MDEKRELLRHMIAAVAYRATRALEGASEGFASFSGASKHPVRILAHMGDLFDWALSMANGKPHWHNSKPLDWAAERNRFFSTLEALDAYLASAEPLHAPIERLVQGPVADALTHVGQLAMMRRLAGEPIHGEDFYLARVETGRVGADQAKPVKTF